MGSSNDTAEGFGIFFLVFAILLTLFVGSAGIGAALLTKFGWRDYSAQGTSGRKPAGAPAPAPPPIPEPPSFEGGKLSRPDDSETSRGPDRSSNQDS
jgi:hypothetical protein